MKTIFCIGGALIDETFVSIDKHILGTSNPAAFYRSAGGVSRNIAHHLSQLGNKVELISHFGNDHDGKWLMDQCTNAGIGMTNSLVNDQPTGRYVALLDNDGNLFAGAAAMFFENEINVDFLTGKTAILKTASIVQTDCNLSIDSLQWIITMCSNNKIPCIIDPVSVAKSKKLKNIVFENVLLITPNKDELIAFTTDDTEQGMIKYLLDNGLKYVWLRNGREGSQMYSKNDTIFQPAANIEIEDVTGAGDAMLAGWIHYFLKDKTMTECIVAGHAMAELVLQNKGGVIAGLNDDLLKQKINSAISVR